MWHEARKQEKKIRGMMVDYKRRAERRRDYYEKIKQDPAQFLQVHGRPAKIHLDPAVAIAADSPATMMPWQGHADNLIDRFDVRAHLDIIPEYNSNKSEDGVQEDRQAAYERYRTLVQNDFLGVNEDKFLHQIFLEERFGIFKPLDDDKKKNADKKAAIGYVYEDSTESPPRLNNAAKGDDDEEENEEEEKEEDLSDIDLDVTVDVNMLTPSQCTEMNVQSIKYGMVDEDFITYLLQDKDEAEQLKLAREIEEEKAMYSGRKSRRERRALREKKLAGRKITSPPSYAARDSPTYTPMNRNSISKSRSRSPPEAGKIMFITSFGGEGSDGEQLGKPSVAGTGKGSKSKDGTSVIGPHLPSNNGDEEKPSRVSRNNSHSDSSKSSYRSKQKNDKSSSKSYSRRRSRHSSHSSSGRSMSPVKSSSHKKRRSRRSYSRSRSRSYSTSKSRSRSRSCHQSRPSKTHSRSRSKSISKMSVDKSESPKLPPPPVKSYYRHSLSRSNSDLSEESDEDKSPVGSPQLSNVPSSSRLQPFTGKAASAPKTKLTPQERLKRKMQLALKKQYKADKQAQIEKTEKQLQERQDRAEELREMAIKLRQRERERRHKQRGYDYDSDSDTTWTKNLESDHGDSSRRKEPDSSRSDSSMSSRADSPPAVAPTIKRRRSRSKSPPRVSRRSPGEERRRSPYRRRSPPRSSPKRSPQRNYTRRSPVGSSRNRSSPSRRYSPNRSPQRRYSPARRHSPMRHSPPRSDSRRYSSSSRHYRHANYSPRKSRSPPRTYGTRPLVDY